MERFSSLPNHPSSISEEAMNALPQHPLKEFALALILYETITAIKQISQGKTSGVDGIPAEIYKQGGYHITRHLTWLFRIIWEQVSVP